MLRIPRRPGTFRIHERDNTKHTNMKIAQRDIVRSDPYLRVPVLPANAKNLEATGVHVGSSLTEYRRFRQRLESNVRKATSG